MSTLHRFFKDTVIYGLATVLPRVMNVILIPLHTSKLATTGYAENTSFYVGAVFLNVLLTMGMETAFFRFFSKSEEKQKVYSTVLIALTIVALLFFGTVWFFQDLMVEALELPSQYFGYLIGVVLLDTLVVAPFAYLRARGKAVKFAGIKLANLTIYVALNFFFLWGIPYFGWQFGWYRPESLLQYIFIANLAASAVTLLLLLPDFFKIKLEFDGKLFGQLWKYGWPIMVAGLAFAVNENLDKLLIGNMLDKDIMGAYSGCYKLAVFMTIFIQAFRLGAEPFFFNHAVAKNAKETYALILTYFVMVGAFGFLLIVLFIDPLKELIIRDANYYKAIEIVPIILLANLCLGIYHNLAVWYKLTDKTRYGMYFSILGAMATIVLNVIFIPIIGFMASAYATLVAYGGMMAMSYFVGRRHYRVPYELGKIGMYLSLAIVFGMLSFYGFKGNFLVSGILLAIFLAVAFFAEKQRLADLLRKKTA